MINEANFLQVNVLPVVQLTDKQFSTAL